MKFYYPKRITYRGYFRKLIKPAMAILYISVPVGTIYGFLKLFEDNSRKLAVFLESKIAIVLFLILFSIPIAICVICLFYYLISSC